ncbi:MAG TPA: DUF2785 domain-containing protein [Metalysinibacillus jejuensis]|uniref:DUF2785 domain-containing protein n=1 Tax=Metalysinibacillus jejuensis TaxID=914327 RepID=A0A921NAS3_9BACL|nr:DUF2785 domain-containing protein [Metalysinibacillus jejuensis]HJH10945.1 DUF2785 domain-containing protein [Metalysinibacillus jejuensis]
MILRQDLQHFMTLSPHQAQKLLTERPTLLNELVTLLGDPDPTVRDDLVYQLFVQWLTTDTLSDSQLHDITTALRAALTTHDGEDSVFMRAYAALLLADLLGLDAKQPFLEEKCAKQTILHIASFLMYETDTRNFVEGKGFANAIPFGADATLVAVNHPQFDPQATPQILHGIKHIVKLPAVFTHDEDERLAAIIEALIIKETPEPLLIEWATQLFDQLNTTLMTDGYSERFFKQRTNTLHLVKTLYFYIKIRRLAPQLEETLYQLIAQWHRLTV